MSSKRFKYQEFLDKYKNCPPSSYKEVEMTAFRWIFETCDEESFKPVLILNPKRSLENDDQKCTAFGLSLFENEVQAYQKYKRFVERDFRLKHKIGSYIAEVLISKNEGICSEPERNNYSHFTFHEYENVDLSKKVVNIVEIFNGDGNFKR